MQVLNLPVPNKQNKTKTETCIWQINPCSLKTNLTYEHTLWKNKNICTTLYILYSHKYIGNYQSVLLPLKGIGTNIVFS